MSEEPERIKCFPLYTILLALNNTQIDLLSLGCQGQELEILQTSKHMMKILLSDSVYENFHFSFLVPWDRVTVDVISIHLVHFSHKIDYSLYISELIKYLEDLSYQLEYIHEKNFIFQKAKIASEHH